MSWEYRLVRVTVVVTRDAMTDKRTLPIGAELLASGGAHFRVWAPVAETVEVEFFDREDRPLDTLRLAPEPGGYHSGFASHARAGVRYRYRLPHGSFPDPASRAQPDGPHGSSQLVDPTFPWTDEQWRGHLPADLVFYELHLGTFTAGGTWQSAMVELPRLVELGVTALEIMPIAEFPGAFGWGYDGVDLFAPSRLYGSPNDARAFVNRAHELGFTVVLDVVYNHLGPDGCFLQEFSPDYFTTKYKCEWGQPLNFDGEHARPVREFFVSNARYWIEEFHFDGLRLDATQQIFDASSVHVIAEITAAVHSAAPRRRTFVIGENEPQNAQLLRERDRGGCAVDALWNDDFHHSAVTALTGKAEAYYSDYRGSPQEFISTGKYGYLFQGQWSRWQQKRRGTPAFDLPAQRFVSFLQNHDQVANSMHGLRVHQQSSPNALRAITTLLLLGPWLPLLFQGQEFAASAPFLYFADHHPDLARQVAEGRRHFLEQFRSIAARDVAGALALPHERATFERCKIDHSERERNPQTWQLHRDLLRLRREDSTLRAPARLDGAVLSDSAFVLRYFGPEGSDRLLLVNLGIDLYLNPAPEPLLAPIAEHGWRTEWSSESPIYGGAGTPEIETSANWIIPGRAAVVLSPHPQRELPRAKISEKD